MRASRTCTAGTPSALLPSHRSYIDPVVLASVLQRAGLPPTYKLGGINVSFWPMGPMGRRAGLIFIRRSFRDDPIYKLALREYVGWLAEHRQNLEWYIEGGRTRTGKLRDPRLGLLAYLVDAVHDGRCDDFVLQPVSIVYDELLDVEEHARSVQGATKAPESLTRLVSYARAQRTRYSRGDIHVAFGEPISVRDHLTRELTEAADAPDSAGAPDALPLQKLAFEVAVRINTVTPITPPALITMALLWADRALTVDQLLVLLERYAVYVDERGFPVTCRPIATRETLLRGLASLQRHGVVTRNDHGREVVYVIQPEQRIAAAYHRNGILHFFVVPAIVDLASSVHGRESEDNAGTLHDDALALRDLFKFEFFFVEKGEFLAEVDAEVAATDRPTTAPFLRPFLEAYWATAKGGARRPRGRAGRRSGACRRSVRVGRAVSAAGAHLLRRRGVELLRRRRDSPGGASGTARTRSRPRGAARRVRRGAAHVRAPGPRRPGPGRGPVHAAHARVDATQASPVSAVHCAYSLPAASSQNVCVCSEPSSRKR